MALQDISFDEVDSVKRVYVVYRVRSDTLVPETVTHDFGIKPTRVFQKGDKFTGKSYDPVTNKSFEEIRERRFSIWDVDTQSLQEKRRVRDHIEYILNILEPQSEKITQYLIQSEKYVISFYIRWEPFGEHGSYQVPGDLLIRMGKLCHFVELSFIATIETE